MTEDFKYFLKKLAFWAPVLFRGTLWVMIEMLRELISTFLSWKHQIDTLHTPITELDVWIAVLKAWLAGFIGCRLFLDQTYSRHIIDNFPNAKTSETEFIRKRIEEATLKNKSTTSV